MACEQRRPRCEENCVHRGWIRRGALAAGTGEAERHSRAIDGNCVIRGLRFDPAGGPGGGGPRDRGILRAVSREAHATYGTQPGGGISTVRGWWVVTALAPFGFLAPVGFAYAAHRVRRPGWYLVAAAWGLLAYGGLALNVAAADGSDLQGFGAALMLIVWFGAFVHALVIRGESD